MGYVIAAIILLLIVAVGVTFLVLNATQRQASAADRDYGEGTPGSDMAIVAPDENTPLGDTDQHAGEQTRRGTTVGGTGETGSRERSAGGTSSTGQGGVGGEAEGSRSVTPESERLANRPR